MDKQTLLSQINETAYTLYQNREQEGLEKTAALLEIFQSMMTGLTEEQVNLGGKFAIIMMQELLENYQQQDILGIADCLMEKAVLFVQFYHRTRA